MRVQRASMMSLSVNHKSAVISRLNYRLSFKSKKINLHILHNASCLQVIKISFIFACCIRVISRLMLFRLNVPVCFKIMYDTSNQSITQNNLRSYYENWDVPVPGYCFINWWVVIFSFMIFYCCSWVTIYYTCEKILLGRYLLYLRNT